LPAAVSGLCAHHRGRIEQVQTHCLMALGEQGAEDSGLAADLAEVGARGAEEVSDLALLGQAAGHQHSPDAAQ